MPQDAFTLRHLAVELNNLFAGGRINRIVQVDENRVYFTIFTGKKTCKLLLDVNPGSPKISVPETEPKSPLTAPNFCMLLRKHLLSATLDKISLVGFDRIVKIDLTSSPEFFDSQHKVLYVELMGRYSNIILTENGLILGANRCLNMIDVGARPLIVYKPYVLPPVQDKIEPNSHNFAGLLQDFPRENNGNTLCQYICKKVQGVAVSTVQECLDEYCKNKNISTDYLSVNIGQFSVDFCGFFRWFIYEKKTNPCVLLKDGIPIDVMAFPYSSLDGEIKPFDTLTEAENFYHKIKDEIKQFTLQRERAKNLVNSAIKKANKRLSHIRAKEKDCEDCELNKIKGELILSNLYRIKAGSEFCELENFYQNNEVLKILLDKKFTPQRNAELYFKRYNKQKRTIEAIVPQKQDAIGEIEYLNALLSFIDRSENLDDLQGVYSELSSLGLIKQAPLKKGEKREQPKLREYTIDGFSVKVGRSNTENDRLLKETRADCIWLHAKDYHSSHVIIESFGKEVKLETIIKSAEICAYYSPLRESGSGEIVYTQKKNVKKPSGAKAGFVTYENYRSINVKPNKNEQFVNYSNVFNQTFCR